MATQPIDSYSCRDWKTQTELELLEAIVQTEIPYPWNPAMPESDAYLKALEKEFAVSDCLSDADTVKQSQVLFAQFEQLWSVATLKKSLFEKFARVPQDLLAGIAQRVENVTVNYQSLADQMVQCVLELLPQWGEEDLQVLARPLAYAMREAESEMMDLPLAEGRCWAELSEIEQAKASLAIAHYALSQLRNSD